MANVRVFFSDLKSGKCSSFVEVRLLRFWEAKNIKKGGELMWIDMLLVDVNSTMMQATIGATRIPKFRSKLAAGSMFTVSGFDISRCAQSYKLTDSPLLIRFNDSTVFEELLEPVSPLPAEGFRFRNQTELVGLANSNTHLADVIGEIIGVKSTVSDPPVDKNRIMATIKLDGDETVTLSLFDEQALAFHKHLDNVCGDPKVIVATSINPKMIGGRLFLKATSGTHVYFDKESRAGEDLLYRLVARDTGLPSAAPLLKGYAKVEALTISELNDFIIAAFSQVARVNADQGWCYVACSKCSKKLDRTVSSFSCTKCPNDNVVGTLRYRVEMAIANDTAEATFVWFDGVMTKLHNLRASDAGQMLAEDGVNPEDSKMPPFIPEMAGKTYTFQVRVNAYNFTHHHKTFTITRVIDEIDRVALPDVDDNGGGDDNDDDMSASKKLPIGIGSSPSISNAKAHENMVGTALNVSKKARVE